MLDSVTIRTSDFIQYSTKHFTKAKSQELKGKFGVFGKTVTHYTSYPKQCASEGRYFPQVQILERLRKTKHGLIPQSRTLDIQVSLPKLIFGSNIFDFDEKLLPLAADKLAQSLLEIDIRVTVFEILNAIVTRVDFSKMIQISPSYGTTDRILRALMPYDMKQSSDFNRRDYHDGKDGFYIKFFNSSQGFVIYNKFDEIVTNGKTNLEQEIGRQYKQGKWTKGALRIELSLQKKQTVDSAMRQFSGEKKKNYTLQDVVKNHIAKACLLRTFESVYIKDFNRLLRLEGLKDTELMLIIKDNTTSLHDRAILYYLAHSVRDRGLKSTIEELKRHTSPATVGRYKKLIEKILGEVEAKKDVLNPVSYLHRKLKAFNPVLPKKLINILDVADEVNKL
ncbi:hypothetical protein A3C17_04635 [Candidatus Uhrbacteria bacterium RIFCSPHIGHO2_02_FULL_53_13]|uniref:Replication-associated protein G2P N-terminal domain-containing protein n=1 Tax=Candidatus Uhrbacteria bacterium RIFCSPHIGHO2_02_FULL_53_13 TaxID=1802389 RepID=A0A1F7U191_9BACT|nr:MAG: hypothetical protein A3C17_04635 [Candidatus Uhrbacteria bacterium RIFCSPHIGHO2_02_FULL_53_13]